jgi:hypothetical protein
MRCVAATICLSLVLCCYLKAQNVEPAELARQSERFKQALKIEQITQEEFSILNRHPSAMWVPPHNRLQRRHPRGMGSYHLSRPGSRVSLAAMYVS